MKPVAPVIKTDLRKDDEFIQNALEREEAGGLPGVEIWLILLGIFDFPTFGLPINTFTRLQSSRRSLMDLKFLISTQLRKLFVFGVVFSIAARQFSLCKHNNVRP